MGGRQWLFGDCLLASHMHELGAQCYGQQTSQGWGLSYTLLRQKVYITYKHHHTKAPDVFHKSIIRLLSITTVQITNHYPPLGGRNPYLRTASFQVPRLSPPAPPFVDYLYLVDVHLLSD
jgi:hypothetical protein